MSWTEVLKELAQKALTVGIMAAAAAVQGGAPIDRGLAAVFAYAVWTQVIVPRVNEALLGNERETNFGTPVKTAWELI